MLITQNGHRLFYILFFISFSLLGEQYSNQTTVIDNFRTLDNIRYLKDEQNTILINDLLSQIDSPQNRFLKSAVYAKLAELYFDAGSNPVGKSYLTKAVSAINASEYNKYTIKALSSISRSYSSIGKYAEAIEHLNLMYDFGLDNNDAKAKITSLSRLGLIQLELQLFDLAESSLGMALEKAIELGDEQLEYRVLLYISNFRLMQPNTDHTKTLDMLKRARLMIGNFHIKSIGYLLRVEGLTHNKLGDSIVAKKLLDEALKLANNDQDLRLTFLVNQDLANIYFTQGKLDLALIHANEALGITNQIKNKRAISELNYLLSKIHRELGDNGKALTSLTEHIEFQSSNLAKSYVGMMYTMEKRIQKLSLERELSSLERDNLAKQIKIQSNEQATQLYLASIAVIVAITFAIILVLVHRHRMMKEKVNYSMKDSLTGCYGRNYLNDYLPSLKSRFDRQNTSLSESIGAVIIDCDNFKPINDNYGHSTGDMVLKAIATELFEQLRDSDLLVRWGGDEFVLVCENITLEQLKGLSCRIKDSVSNLRVIRDGINIPVSISTGYALHNFQFKFDFDGLLNCADSYLYDSKNNGKNESNGGVFRPNTAAKIVPIDTLQNKA